MPSVFISYKRNHTASELVAAQVERTLRDAGLQPYRDVGIPLGAHWSKELYQSLLDCDAAVAVVTEDAARTDWCRREWAVLAARSEVAGLLVIPVHVSDAIVTTGILDHLQCLLAADGFLDKLLVALGSLRSRPRSAADFLALHQAWLKWQFYEARVFGQEPYSLADVYVDTECGELVWNQLNESRGNRADPFEERHGGRVDLVSAVLSRFADPRFRDLIVVQAGPGSGKSAFALRLATTLSDRGFTPILVRFRDLRLATFSDVADVLDDAIRIGNSDEDSPSPTLPIVASALSTFHSIDGTTTCRAVFILDGWDEVSLTGNASYQAQLKDWLPKLREFFHRRGAPIRIVLTGRPSAEVGQSGILKKDTPVLTMRPIRPEQLRRYMAQVHQSLVASNGEPRRFFDMSKIEPIFVEYEAWFDSLSDANSKKRRSHAEVLGNPLLAYLTLRVIAESSLEPSKLLNEPTAVYHELIETTVRHAGKAEGEQDYTSVHRGGEQLRRLLHEVASTITILGSETVTFTELKARFENPRLPVPRNLLGDWAATAHTDATLRELVINFYFKGGHTALGCEFLHKSFREYLHAEAIVFALSDSLETPERFKGYDGLQYWEKFPETARAHRLSRRLSYLLAAQWLSAEVAAHLRWLLDRACAQQPARWTELRDLATEVYAWWSDGVHLRHQPTGARQQERWLIPFVDQLFEQLMPCDSDTVFPIRSTTLDAHLGEALLHIVAMLHWNLRTGLVTQKGRRSRYQSVEGGRVRFRPGGGGSMHLFIARIDSAGWRRVSGLMMMPLDGVDLCQERLARLQLQRVRLRGASARSAQLSFSGLGAASLEGADLRAASLRAAILVHAELGGANLVDADLRFSDCSGADFTGANLTRAHLAHANFTGATLKSACLSGARLNNANLKAANLASADLRGADLRNCSLYAAYLEGAQVSRTGILAAANVEFSGDPIYIDDAPPTTARPEGRE